MYRFHSLINQLAFNRGVRPTITGECFSHEMLMFFYLEATMERRDGGKCEDSTAGMSAFQGIPLRSLHKLLTTGVKISKDELPCPLTNVLNLYAF